MSWPTLLSPLALGPLTLPNRVVMPAMDPSLADADGFVTDAMVHHYAARAQGAGLLVTGNVGCDLGGRVSGRMPLLSDDRYIEGFKRLTDAVHAEGGLVFVQISHAGRQTLPQFAGGETVSASAIACPLMRVTPRALETEEVGTLAQRFAEACARAQQAGADGVELHMAHGYLVCQFLSPYSNHRTDRYGGDEAGRAAFAVEILAKTRALVGPDFPIQCRLSADERVEGGITPDLATAYARRLVKAGATSLSISACNYESYRYNMPGCYLPEATYAPLARVVRDGLGDHAVPIVAVGRIATGDVAERVLTDGDADLVAVGRALIAEPLWAEKLVEGRPEAIRPCLQCNRCAESIARGPIQCLVNPEVGRGPTPLIRSETPQRVHVVGGGPAGITAAIEAARAGHTVTLFEAEDRLGGKVWAGAAPPEKDRLEDYARWLIHEATRAPITVVTGARLSADDLRDADADVVLMAVGATPKAAPDVPGLTTHPLVLGPEAALTYEGPIRHALIIGGGPEGCEVADGLSLRAERPKVSVVEPRRKPALGLPSSIRALLHERLLTQGVDLHLGRSVGHLDEAGVTLVDRRGREKARLPPADLVVVAIGVETPGWLPQGAHLHTIGDARAPATILEAVAEGWRIGRSL